MDVTPRGYKVSEKRLHTNNTRSKDSCIPISLRNNPEKNPNFYIVVFKSIFNVG